LYAVRNKKVFKELLNACRRREEKRRKRIPISITSLICFICAILGNFIEQIETNRLYDDVINSLPVPKTNA